MSDTPRHINWSCVLGLHFWLLSIAAWVGLIVYDAFYSDPLSILALWVPCTMMAFWITALCYWCFYARRDARQGRGRPERIVAFVSWTVGSLFFLFLAILMLAG